jgi:sarcosine oxidase delta subunit
VGDQFRKVLPGDPLKIPAEAWNALVDLSQDQKNQRHDQFSHAEGTSRQTSLAKVRNQTGVDLDRFSIVALGTPIITPAANLKEFKRQVSFQGLVPGAGTGPRFGVLLEPLKNSLIGTAAIGGCVITRVSVGSVAYNAAETIVGQNGYLRSVPHGPASVLWIESTGALRWAVIRFDDANYEEIVFITSNIPDGNGYYPGVVQKFDIATKSWSSVFDCKVVDANK